MIHHPLAERVGWILLHSLWQGALIGVGFGLLRLALRKQSAQARYLVGCVCLALMMAAPLLTLMMSPVPVRDGSAGSQTQVINVGAQTVERIAEAPIVSGDNRVLAAMQGAAIMLGQMHPELTTAELVGV